jgi:thiol-disulfide isomerase/thioredoxin
MAAVFPPAGGEPEYKGRTMDGTVFSRASLRGKPVLVQFWATWCGYCRKDEPAIERIAAEQKQKLVVLAVNVKENAATVKKYVEASKRKTPMVLTEETNLLQLIQPRGFPHYSLFDREGRLVGEQPGAGGYEALQMLIARVGL